MAGETARDKEYLLWNATDDIFASPETFATLEDAEAAAAEFRARFKTQGYYLTAAGLRIAPDDIQLEIIPAQA